MASWTLKKHISYFLDFILSYSCAIKIKSVEAVNCKWLWANVWTNRLLQREKPKCISPPDNIWRVGVIISSVVTKEKSPVSRDEFLCLHIHLIISSPFCRRGRGHSRLCECDANRSGRSDSRRCRGRSWRHQSPAAPYTEGTPWGRPSSQGCGTSYGTAMVSVETGQSTRLRKQTKFKSSIMTWFNIISAELVVLTHGWIVKPLKPTIWPPRSQYQTELTKMHLTFYQQRKGHNQLVNLLTPFWWNFEERSWFNCMVDL